MTEFDLPGAAVCTSGVDESGGRQVGQLRGDLTITARVHALYLPLPWSGQAGL